jgi:hypothetical protein
MNKTTIVAALLALALVSVATLAGCNSDPHDTHIVSGVTSPR